MRTNSFSASIASAVPPLLEQVVVQRLEALAGFFLLAHLLERPRGGEPGLEVRRVDGPEPDDDFGSAAPIALGAAARGNGVEVRLGVGEQTLPGGDVGELNLGRLVLRLELEDLLVERRGLRVEALVDEVLGDAGVLPDGLLRLPGAGVELAERIGGAPVARDTPRRRGRTRRSPARGDPGGAASPPFSAWRHGRRPRGFSTGRRLRGARDMFSKRVTPSYQTAMAGGTSAGARRSSRSARPRRGDPRVA